MKIIKHKFVEFVPDQLEDEIIYISIKYRTAVHNCICGCGNKVVTPLSPTDWKITFNGKTISFYPSIGNWGFPCKSHYWIRENRIEWSELWSKEQINEGRKQDKINKANYFTNEKTHEKKSDHSLNKKRWWLFDLHWW